MGGAKIGADDSRSRLDFGWAAVCDDLPKVQGDHPVAHAHDQAHPVFDEQNRHASLCALCALCAQCREPVEQCIDFSGV